MDERPRYSFPPSVRLRSRREYLRVRERGRKLHTPHFLILAMENPGGFTRLGVTASRKVGGAVIRNRVKRLVREFFRTHYPRLPQGVEFSVIAKPGASTLGYRDVCRELEVMCSFSPASRP